MHPSLEHPHNYEESVRKLEFTSKAQEQKTLLKKYSLEKHALIDVRLFVGQVPKSWNDPEIFNYFQKMAEVLEAKIIRDKYDQSHRGCAFLKLMKYHDAELILDMHRPRARRICEEEGINSRL